MPDPGEDEEPEESPGAAPPDDDEADPDDASPPGDDDSELDDASPPADDEAEETDGDEAAASEALDRRLPDGVTDARQDDGDEGTDGSESDSSDGSEDPDDAREDDEAVTDGDEDRSEGANDDVDGGDEANDDGDDDAAESSGDDDHPDPIGPTDHRPTVDNMIDPGPDDPTDAEREAPNHPDEEKLGPPDRAKGPKGSKGLAEATTDAATDAAGTTTGGLMDAEIGHAPDDEEQPLEVHITEMVHRFLAVAVAMAGVAAIALLWSDDLINFLWYSFLGPGAPLCPGNECPQIFKPHLYHPLSLVLARLKISALVGFVVGLPIAVYQTYLFMRPGLYPRERRYYLAAVPTSLVLAAVGIAFAHLLVLPALFSYFVGYTTRAAEPALGLAETFNIIVIMLGFFALVFQIPLLVMLAIMMGVTTRRWLESRRLYFWMGFGGVAFIFSPDPTGMAPLLVALTMITLFEGTLTLLRWTGKDSPILAPEPMRARRPYAWALAVLAGYVASSAPLPTSYYGYLPTAVTDTIADAGLTAFTPLIAGVTLVAVFEIITYLLRRFGAGLQVQLWIYKLRRPWWVGAAVVGYLASPDPGLLEAAREIQLEPVGVAGVVIGIVVAYEILVQLIVWRRG